MRYLPYPSPSHHTSLAALLFQNDLSVSPFNNTQLTVCVQRTILRSNQTNPRKPIRTVLTRMFLSSQSLQPLSNQFPILLLNLRRSLHKQLILLLIKQSRSDLLCFLQIAQSTVFFVKLAGFEGFAAVHGYEEAVAFVAIVYCGAGDVADSSGGNAVCVDDVGDFVEG